MNHRSDADDRAGPLSDVAVLDMTQILAGPFATMLLADLGADVVKVEPPGGDFSRSNAPFLDEDDPFGGYFQSVNRNKRSLALDLKSEDGRDAFLALAAEADVVIENFRVGTMERLDLGFETLRDANPGLVYASVRGFGDPRLGESPYAERPAFDFIAQAMSGVMSVTGTEGSGPTKVGPGVGDIFPGVLAAVGILSALRERDRTGTGQHVDVGMVDGLLALAERIVHQYSYTGSVPEPQGNSHPIFFPYDRFETRDGYVVVAAPETDQWTALCEHMDRPDLAAEYADKGARAANADALRPEVQDWVGGFRREELLDLLEDDVPCAPVYTAGDVFEDEHFEARDMLVDVSQPGSDRSVTVAGQPIKFSRTPGGVRRRAPLLGEHTREVLAAAGYGEEVIDAMVADGDAVTGSEAE